MDFPKQQEEKSMVRKYAKNKYLYLGKKEKNKKK